MPIAALLPQDSDSHEKSGGTLEFEEDVGYQGLTYGRRPSVYSVLFRSFGFRDLKSFPSDIVVSTLFGRVAKVDTGRCRAAEDV